MLSVIIDGADQAKFALPRFPTQTKREGGHGMKQKVTGVLFHGSVLRQDLLCFFTAADNIPSGANQTIDALSRALFVLLEKREAHGIHGIPEQLHIQLDNTSKDNKNRFFFAFCDLMVHVGLFCRVTVSFLPVGHTHEDIDRRFSRVSVHLKHRATVTISDLHHALQNSQYGRLKPFVARGTGMNKFSGALTEQRVVVPQVDNLKSFRRFTFEVDLSEEQPRGAHFVSVTCMVAHNMRDKRGSWTKLERKDGYIGAFLRKVPNMRLASQMKTKEVPADEIDAFKKRIRLTEARICDAERTRSLLLEIERIEKQQSETPDWNVQKLLRLASQALRQRALHVSEEIDDEIGTTGDGCTYEIGDMVTVNCGSSSTSATPFWLGKIEDVKESTSGGDRLLVHWYELLGQQAGTDLCYKGKYSPMRRCLDSQTEMSSATILVEFGSLRNDGRIPDLVQRYTREALDPFGDEE